MMKLASRLSTVAVAAALVLASGCSHEVKPDTTMSAPAHLQQARIDTKEANAARDQAMKVTPPPPDQDINPSSNPQGYYYPVNSYNPGGEYLARARELEAHAREHRAAAAKLEAFEQDECKGFPPATRAACPLLGAVEDIHDIPNGVEVRFSPRTCVSAVVAHMRCHLAYARAYGFDMVPDCPLYVQGLVIRASDDGKAVDLIGPDTRTANLIRARAREEAILVRR